MTGLSGLNNDNDELFDQVFKKSKLKNFDQAADRFISELPGKYQTLNLNKLKKSHPYISTNSRKTISLFDENPDPTVPPLKKRVPEIHQKEDIKTQKYIQLVETHNKFYGTATAVSGTNDLDKSDITDKEDSNYQIVR